jgi:hypothetical protein
MNKSIFLLIVLAVLSIRVSADTKTDKIKKVMEIQGQVQMWQEAIDSGKKQSEKLGETAMDQLMSNLSPSSEFKKKFNDAFNIFLAKVQAPWTAAEIVDKWASFYGPQFTESELDQLIAFYSSDLGSKDISATRRAMTQFQAYYQKAGTPIFEKATKEYVEEIKLIAHQCKCEKKPK